METHYVDRRVRISEPGFTIKGLPIPAISIFRFTWDEVERIEVIPMGYLRRLWLMGPSNPRTWWAFDPIRALRGRAFIIHFKKGIATFDRIGLTVSNPDQALNAIRHHAGHLLDGPED